MSTKPELPWTEGLTPIPNPVEMKLLSMESLPELPKPGRGGGGGRVDCHRGAGAVNIVLEVDCSLPIFKEFRPSHQMIPLALKS
jgi:hypothetical protein